MKKNIFFVLCLLFYSCSINFEVDSSKENASCIKEDEKKQIKLPNDIRWVTNSSEYKILCEQTYQNAWDNLSNVLKIADSKSAIIMDLDETVLDNSKYQIGLIEKNESYNPELVIMG